MRWCFCIRPFLASLLLSLISNNSGVGLLADASETVAADGLEYARYSQYPEYCSTPEQLEGRRILLPSIPSQTKKSTNRLVHVTIVSRHGTRAPKGKHECWPSFYAEYSDTAKWDCSLTMRTTLSYPPSDSALPERQSFLLESIYNGVPLSNSLSNSTISNILNGTCQVAQLLRKGFQQHLWNGRMLRETYFYRKSDRGQMTTISNETAPPERTILQFLSASLDHSQYLRVRSDDTPRTMLSGQALLVGMLADDAGRSNQITDANIALVIPIHTADKVRDVLSDNDELCPKLKDLESKAYDSKDYEKLKKKYDMKKTKNWMKDHFGYSLDHPLQCLMSAICCDLSLPDTVNDYGRRKSTFTQLALYELTRKNFVYSYDRSAYAKLSMGPLWRDILDNVYLCLRQETNASAPRLSYYSGHDSTISQLLASLGSKVWRESDSVPYASLLVLEVYESRLNDGGDPDYSFRLLLNGKPLTGAIKHCHTDVCDFRILEERLKEFVTDLRDCHRKSKKPNNDLDKVVVAIGDDAFESTAPPISSIPPSITSSDLYDPQSIWFRCLLSIAGFALGSTITWRHMRISDKPGQAFRPGW